MGGLIVYELIRARVVRLVATRLRRSTQDFVRRHDVRLDQFKFMNKAYIEAELQNDPELNVRIVAAAQAEGRTVLEIREQVSEWIDEIVPLFNLSSYFKLGQPLARAALNGIYDVVVDTESLERIHHQLPADSALVYVMNHRSNADYVLVAHMLSRKIALSYAVGEWARVWPLEGLFKSFGSYFIRRRYPNPLYHAVLEKYVQLISRRGVSQGVFPEGGLSRDGLLRDPKVGILGYVAAIKTDPTFTRDVYFVPVGINYDRVIEDEALLDELSGKRKGPLRFAGKLLSLCLLVVRLPVTLAINLWRLIVGRTKRYGAASVSFGAPISLAQWMERVPGPDFARFSRDERKPHLKALASELMGAIGEVVPVSPVPLVCRAYLELGLDAVPLEQLTAHVQALREKLRQRGARFVIGRTLRATAESRERLHAAKEERRAELVDVEESLIGWDEAELTVQLAVGILRARRLASVKSGVLTCKPAARRLLHYYANSIAQLLGGPVAEDDAPAAPRGGASASG